MKNRDILCEWGYEDSIVYENYEYDEAIFGVTMDGNIIYDYNKIIELLCTEYGMTEEEAVEYVDFNMFGFPIPDNGENPPPLIAYRMEDLVF